MRTLKEWKEYCFDKGTSGEMVFDILRDWDEREQEITIMAHKIADVLIYGIPPKEGE